MAAVLKEEFFDPGLEPRVPELNKHGENNIKESVPFVDLTPQSQKHIQLVCESAVLPEGGLLNSSQARLVLKPNVYKLYCRRARVPRDSCASYSDSSAL